MVDFEEIPASKNYESVVMFADVSGFTSMTESLAARGPAGAECLGKYLNSYFEQMLKIIFSEGGDVFKFAGDAIIVLWTENIEDSHETLVLRAVQCALRIQQHLDKAELAPGVTLCVKMGIGFGGLTIAHLGNQNDGCSNKVEYIAVGPSLIGAFDAESKASPGQVILAASCGFIIDKMVDGIQLPCSDYFRAITVKHPIKRSSRTNLLEADSEEILRLRQFVPRSVWPFLNAREESWGSELRNVTVLFINLGLSESISSSLMSSDLLQRVQDAFSAVQRRIFGYEGTINKFLVDDKGSTVVAVFGLPPIAHENDCVRGILAALAICADLGKLGYQAAIGITSGTTFCGIVGHHGNRREYTVLGDTVNLSARLMQRAKAENGGVITDDTTKHFAEKYLHFESRPEILVKGKNDRIKIHRPYPRMSTLVLHSAMASEKTPAKTSSTAGVKAKRNTRPMDNIMVNMYRVQVMSAHSSMKLPRETLRVHGENLNYSISARDHIRDRFSKMLKSMSPSVPSATLIVEAETGLGKTHLLCRLLNNENTKKLRVLVATGSPFLSQDDNPYNTIVDLINCERAAIGLQEHTQANEWTAYLKTKILKFCNTIQMQAHCYLLNSLLHTNFKCPNIDTVSDIKRNESMTSCFFGMIKASRSEYGECLLDLDIDDQPQKTPHNNFDDEEHTGDAESNKSTVDIEPAGILLLHLLYAFTCERGLVIAVDSAMHLHEKTWQILSFVASSFQNCTLVLAARPPCRSRSVNAVRSVFRKQLRLLKRQKHVEVTTLEPLAPLHTENLALSLLRVESMPRELGSLLVSRSEGNPLFLTELIQEMLDRNVIVIDKDRTSCSCIAQEPWADRAFASFCFECHTILQSSKKRHRCKCCGYIFCSLCTPPACRRKIGNFSQGAEVRHCIDCYALTNTRRPSIDRLGVAAAAANAFLKLKRGALMHHRTTNIMLGHTESASPLKNRTALHPPPAVKSVITAWLDELTVSQRMILKTASVIGPIFEIDVLRGAYPINEHLPRLQIDIEELVRLGMIRSVDICAEGGVLVHSTKFAKYEFNHGFMVDVLRHQMLSGQLDKLYLHVKDYRELRDRQMRQEFFNKTRRSLEPPATPLLETGPASSDTSFQATSIRPLTVSTIALHLRLKAGHVQVRKSSSVFSAIRKQHRWKRRWAVLQNSKLVLQYDEVNGAQPTRCTVLSLDGATISNMLPAFAGKSNCFVVKVKTWIRRNCTINEPRDFIIHVDSLDEANCWLYMARYAIESYIECAKNEQIRNSRIVKLRVKSATTEENEVATA